LNLLYHSPNLFIFLIKFKICFFR